MAVPMDLTKDVLHNRKRHIEFNGLLISAVNEVIVFPLKRKFCDNYIARIKVNCVGDIAPTSISAIVLLKTIFKNFGNLY